MGVVSIRVGAAEITWSCNAAGVLEGIAGVDVDGVPLTDTSFPSCLVFQTPDGFDYRSFRVLDVQVVGDATTLRTEATGTVSDAFWVRDQYDYDILHVGRPRQAPALKVDLELTPREEVFRGTRFTGFRLDVGFRAEGGQVGRFQWRQHWEPGGAAVGNTVYSQSQISPPVHAFTLDSEWSNACWKSLDRPRAPENVSMQFNARCGYHQLFDMVAGPAGVLVGWFEEAKSVQTLCQKNAGEDNYHVWESVDLPLVAEGAVSGKTILFAPGGPRSEAEVRDLWFDIKQHVNASYRRQTGILPSRVLPTLMDGAWSTLPIGDRLYFGSEPDKVPAEDYLESLARNRVPALREQGFRRFWTRPFSVSDTTELMFARKADRGRGVMDGDVQIGSCCCTWKYEPAERFGGGAAARRFYELGHEAGMEIGIWVGNHLSTKAPILKEHPEWVLKDRNFANPAGGYDDLIMAVIDWNSGVRDWILADLLAWKKDYGLDFIFFDSFGNLGLKCRNYARDDLADNFAGVMRFVSDLTVAGIDVICEGLSFIGCPYFGISNDGNMQSEADPLLGQNSLGWFRGNEDMLEGCHPFTENNPKVDARELVKTHFRAMANRGLITVSGGPPELADHFHIYDRVREAMGSRELLEDALGVLWNSGDGERVFFAYRDGGLPLGQTADVSRVEAACETSVGRQDFVTAEAGGVYRIRDL